MKKTLLMILTLILSGYLAAAVSSKNIFKKGYRLLTPEIIAIEHTVALGINFELGYSRNVGIGGDLFFLLEGDGGVVIAPDICYHFELKVQDLDLFMGIGPYLAIGFGGGSEFGVKPLLGMRFYLSPKLAAYFKLIFAITKDPSVGGAFGISFKL